MGQASESKQGAKTMPWLPTWHPDAAESPPRQGVAGPTDIIQNLQGPSPVAWRTGPVLQGTAIQVSLFHQPELEVLSLGRGKTANIIALPPVIRAEYGIFLQGANGGLDVGIVGLEQTRWLRCR